MTFSTEKIVDEGLKAIRNNPKFDFYKDDCFIYPKTIETEAILFLGINPSSNKDQVLHNSCELAQHSNDHQYFRKMEDIAKYCGTIWTHLDLLYFRETKQNTIDDILKNRPHGVDYIWEQLQITNKLIVASAPKVTVVCNALAGKFLGKEQNKETNTNVWLGYEFNFDNKLGTYRWNNIPIFFSGMLTGQRALDKGSYERLRWHINQAIQNT